MQEGDKQEKHEKHVLDQFVSDEEISAEAVEEISHREVTDDTDIEEADKILAMRDRAAKKSSWRHIKYLLLSLRGPRHHRGSKRSCGEGI